MTRTTNTNVQDALGDNYVSGDSVDAAIDAATLLVDRVSTLDTGSVLSSAALEMIERYLAAHFYAISQQIPESEGVGKSSTKWQGRTAMGLDFTQYGQHAMLLDFTGTLKSINAGKSRPNITWLGQRASEAEYDD